MSRRSNSTWCQPTCSYLNLSEQAFGWSGLPVAHLRVTFFAEWLLYIAPLIWRGRYVVPFDAESRFAPMPASDIARVIVGILENPKKHVGEAYPLHGPVECSHQELAATVGRVLGKEVRFEQVSVSAFLELLGLENDSAKRSHFESVRIDRQERLLEGTEIIGHFGVAPTDLDALAITDPHAAVAVDVAALKANPLLPGEFIVSGLVYDVATGQVEVVVPPALLRPPSAA